MPVMTYAFNVHMGIPSLTHPIKQKQYLHWLIMFTFGSIAFAYLSLGIVAPLWFRATIQETVTLNWVSRKGYCTLPLHAFTHHIWGLLNILGVIINHL